MKRYLENCTERERRTPRRKRIFGCIAPLLLFGFSSMFVHAQTLPGTQPPTSDLAGKNLERVAASAAQLEVVLRKDAGLMVELKRWLAKDATDHGQFVSDIDLTDQAIYERIQADIQFRSVATVLVQKYGYLLPQFNPDSPQGKEQELVIQNRAKWIAQEAELEISQARQQRMQSLQQTSACDPKQEADCHVQKRPYSEKEEEPEEIGTPVLPSRRAPGSHPELPGTLLPNTAGLEQTRLGSPEAEGSSETTGTPLGGSSETMAALLQGLSQAGPGTLSPTSLGNRELSGSLPQLGTDGSTANAALLKALASSGSLPTMDTGERTAGGNEGLPEEAGSLVGTEASRRAYEREGRSLTLREPYRPHRNPSLSRALVRQPVPYAAIPSLYDMYLQAAPQPPNPERFGTEVFENGSRDSQLIPFDLPAGPDYVVGPGDGLAIDLWGGVSQRLRRTVDREGRVSLPEVGPLLVAGKSLAEVQESVQRVLRSQFRDVSADVSLSRLRTIRVYVVGDVTHPGAYDIRSLSTPLNALFVAGGPTSQGSLRILKHNRGERAVQNVDIYDLLLHGVRTDIQRLENGDTVLVPPIGPQVSVEGMVRRPAIYELHDEKSLSEVLSLAGGLLPTATLRHIEVQRVVTHEKRTMVSLDVQPDADPATIAKQLDSFQVQDGDRIRVFPIAPYNQDTLYLEGHVLRPGKYSYRPGMRVTDLIASYKDLLPEPATRYAEIIRLNPPDYRPTVESFNLDDALSHPGSAPLLQALDTVQVFGRYDFEEPPTVSVWGDVRVPGTYQTSGQLRLGDAIHMAGGLAPDAEQEDAQVFRYLPDGQLKIFSVKLGEALVGNSAENIALNSRDRILVHRNAASVEPATVYIQGEVARPGRYPLTTNMSVADLIRAAGGPKQSADLKNADLTRYGWNAQSRMSGQREEIVIAEALAGSNNANVSLHNGDVLTIRQLAGWEDLGASIAVRGEVMHAGTYGIQPGERLSSILRRAGGFMPEAYPYGAVLVRAQVQQLEDKSRTELIERVRSQGAALRLAAKTEQDPENRMAQEAAYHQWENTLEDLTNNRPVGRVVIHISTNYKSWEGTARDITVRAGDKILIPKRPGYVMVQGQVFNPTAIAYRSGKSARWYLSQAGGPTNLANKKAIFVIRADGSVFSTRGSSPFAGDALAESLEPGDTVAVPEKALGGPPVWKAVFQGIQVASSVATAAIFAAKY